MAQQRQKARRRKRPGGRNRTLGRPGQGRTARDGAGKEGAGKRNGKGQSPVIRVRGEDPEDLLGLIPYLVGFHPRDSLVLVAFTGTTYRVTMRLDLSALATDPAGRADYFAAICAAHGIDRVVVVVYADEWGERLEPVDTFLPLLEDGLADVGVLITGAQLVVGDRWWCLACGCCPPEGRPYEPGNTRTAAEAVFHGLAARGSRGDLEASVPDDTTADPLAFEAARDWVRSLPLEDRTSTAVGLLHRHVSGDEISAEDCCRLGALVAQTAVRDAVLFETRRADGARLVDLWTQVVRRTPVGHRVDPLCILGLVAWLSGDGALMLVCLDRAEVLDPGHRLTALLHEVAACALPPESWDSMSEMWG